MITVAIIGCGRIANYAHLPALSKQDNVRIKYACDIIKEKAIKAKENFPKIEKVIVDYQEALDDKEVDAVFVLVPNYEHKRITIDALRKGKHVLCEKPISLSYESALEMEKEAQKANKILNIGVNNRFDKVVNALKEYIDQGKIGHVYHVDLKFMTTRSIPGVGGPFTDKSKSGGGVLIDWGVHILDIVQYLIGINDLVSVSAEKYSELAKDMQSYHYGIMWAEDTADIKNGINDVEEMIAGFIRFKDYSLSLLGAWATNVPADEFYIDLHGSKAGARLTFTGQFRFFDGDTLVDFTSEIDKGNHYEFEDEAFIKSVETGITNQGYISQVIKVAKLLDMIYQSAEEGKEIRL